uniref:Signal recognition particle 19 kDa protein n=1 Tax=Arundo donax TaxID=35708 RepID=A0A0A9FSP3_ARUDO
MMAPLLTQKLLQASISEYRRSLKHSSPSVCNRNVVLLFAYKEKKTFRIICGEQLSLCRHTYILRTSWHDNE